MPVSAHARHDLCVDLHLVHQAHILCLALQVEREIRIHSRLDHPNIIRLFAAFEDDANIYMVQEYATGMCSFTKTQRPPPIPPKGHTDPT